MPQEAKTSEKKELVNVQGRIQNLSSRVGFATLSTGHCNPGNLNFSDNVYFRKETLEAISGKGIIDLRNIFTVGQLVWINAEIGPEGSRCKWKATKIEPVEVTTMEESVMWSYENLYFIQMLAATGSKDVRDLVAAVQNAPEIVKKQVRPEEKSIKEFLAKSPQLFIVENNVVSLGADSLIARKMEAEVKACCKKAIKRAGFKKNFQSMTGVLSQCKAAARAYIGGMDGLRRFFARHENTFRVQDEEHEEVIIPVDEETDSKSSAVEADAMEFLTRLVARHNGEMNLDDIANELKKNPQIELQTNKLLTFLQDHSSVFLLNGTSVGLVAERDDSIYSSLESAPSNRYFSRRPTVGAGRIIRRRDSYAKYQRLLRRKSSSFKGNTFEFSDNFRFLRDFWSDGEIEDDSTSGVQSFETTNLGFGLLNLGDLHESLRFSTQSLPDTLENNLKSPDEEDEEYSLCGSDVSSRPYREEIESNLNPRFSISLPNLCDLTLLAPGQDPRADEDRESDRFGLKLIASIASSTSNSGFRESMGRGSPPRPSQQPVYVSDCASSDQSSGPGRSMPESVSIRIPKRYEFRQDPDEYLKRTSNQTDVTVVAKGMTGHVMRDFEALTEIFPPQIEEFLRNVEDAQYLYKIEIDAKKIRLRFQTDEGRKTVVTSYTENPCDILQNETIRKCENSNLEQGCFDGQYFIEGTLHEISLLEIGKVVALTISVVLPKVDKANLKKAEELIATKKTIKTIDDENFCRNVCRLLSEDESLSVFVLDLNGRICGHGSIAHWSVGDVRMFPFDSAEDLNSHLQNILKHHPDVIITAAPLTTQVPSSVSVYHLL
ncbi:Oidioi.mRNA.OKI2018_I69.chr1.g3595.t1.cds [Oikopleura dioica]|uniref:Oidioi.mRNA.OKI2018_I69.chr1.g3595.t1.cds n=1 Tax=Oikopleura dioica TaxID=34765 RepID=A0ABN7SUF5_OIKDI|nr:Oidioi.mRNA.OKI2018_I69.chr1.g3595.t1.cds [Oikopleura dioica]